MPRNPRRNPSLTKSSKLIKVNSTPTSCFNIPIDLEIKILERLPVKTLVTITAVCKSWYSIVKTPHILNRYHNSSIIDPEQEGHALLMSRGFRNGSEIECVVVSQDSFVVRNTFAFNFIYDVESNLENIGSCCNGVICLCEDDDADEDDGFGKEVYLFNPSIRKLRPLPSSSIEERIKESGNEVERFVGFGYDEIADDYKVLKAYHIFEDTGSDSTVIKYAVKVEAEVYSLTSDTWKTVEANDRRYNLSGRCVSVNNAIHWLSRADDGDMIVAFDFSDEVFREILLPVDTAHGVSMVSYKGSLAILVLEDVNEVDGEESEEYEVTVSLWIMKEYCVKESWSKELTWVIHRLFEEAVNFTNNGKLIFHKTDYELAIWYPETEQVVDLDGFPDYDYSIVEDYIESLILI